MNKVFELYFISFLLSLKIDYMYYIVYSRARKKVVGGQIWSAGQAFDTTALPSPCCVLDCLGSINPVTPGNGGNDQCSYLKEKELHLIDSY
ncbi:hypothetical protein Btru_027438 [Bulinus truncatus]|nr:hypothetical protein Btru_027438 [Bulinus truncatus]